MKNVSKGGVEWDLLHALGDAAILSIRAFEEGALILEEFVAETFGPVLANPELRTALFAAMGFPDIRPWYNGGFLVSPAKEIPEPHPDDNLF